MKRTTASNTSEKVGETVVVKGWVDSVRSHGKIVFIDVRDRTGLVQVVFEPDQKDYQKAKNIKKEYVVKIEGEVEERPEQMINPDLKSGEIEIQGEEIEVLSESETPPIDVHEDGYEISEEKRLEYRYLDLRRERLQKNLKQRKEMAQFIRNYLIEKDFIEIETPCLTKSTPEGARDFVVPSRSQPGKFYALPQSPQQYKQLLMTAGFERYFQFPHVFRDEDLRADRLFEHTQLDIEMSFVGQEDIKDLVEQLAIQVTENVLGKEIKEKPFPVLTYEEAMSEHGRDDPDLREEEDQLAYCWITDFPMFEQKEDGSLGAEHHPFTAVKEEHLDKLEQMKKTEDKSSLVQEIKAQQYDLVLNGHEIFGGSIRQHRPQVVRTVFEILGHSQEEIQEKFGHLLEAFKYGVPPHGGIAAGFDRWLQALLNERSIREVVAFPTTSSGKTAVMDAPSELSSEKLEELHLKIIEED